MIDDDGLSGMVPDSLKARQQRIVIDRIEVLADIGFHAFEIGTPQRLLISIELWIDPATPPADDDPAQAWDYDVVVQAVRTLATQRRYNLQETLVNAIFLHIGALHGISALKVSSTKPDVYPDARGVGIEIASFRGVAP
ncbi:MAG: dihydroneopterin aldolase [Sphingomonas bacterium]|nr:dihydroneopterin aldolase [Sphingomonas bacterium]